MRALFPLFQRRETVHRFGPDGFDRYGFDRAGLHRDTRDRYGPDGRDAQGLGKPLRVPMLLRR